MKRIAVITGASSGLGRAYAHELAKDDAIEEIWALARHEDRLNTLRNEVGKGIVPIPLDLTKRGSFDELGRRLKAEKPHIAYAIGNAGIARFCATQELDIEDAMEMIDLNCRATIAFSLLCLPYMEWGDHQLLVASQAAFQPLPGQNVYSATKALIRHYARALNRELKGRGITVTAVCPGWMRTHLYDQAIVGSEMGTRKFPGMVKPQFVAEKSLKDARQGRDMSVYSARVKGEHAAAKLLPQRIMMELFLRQQEICFKRKKGKDYTAVF